MTTELWLPIPMAPDYAVSNLGRVKRLSAAQRTQPDAIRKDYAGPRGYRYVTLRVNKRPKGFQVHRLVMAAFRGLSGLVVNHIDGDKGNNRLENLEYTTPAGNTRHAADVLGSLPKGENHHNARLTTDSVRRIFQLRKSGATTHAIAAEMGCTPQNVQAILLRKSWRHVQVE